MTGILLWFIWQWVSLPITSLMLLGIYELNGKVEIDFFYTERLFEALGIKNRAYAFWAQIFITNNLTFAVFWFWPS